MDRNREARRATMVTSSGTNGLSRRRHRSNSLRDSPEEEGVGVELQETVRLRERKKERERDRERSSSSRSKRRRGGGVGDSNRLVMRREDAIGDDTSEEDDSVNDDHGVEDEDDEDRMLPPPGNPPSSTFSNHHHHHHHLQRKSFPPPPPSKNFRPPWKPADDHIGVSVPRKARSASTKRGHDWSGSGPSSTTGSVVGGEQVIHRQASTSPVRTSVVVQAPTASPSRISPSSNISIRKKMKPTNGGSKHRQPFKSSSKSSPSNTHLSASNQDEIEIEIAEVLYGMMRQPQGGSGGAGGCPARPDGETGATNSSTVSISALLVQNSSSSNTPVTVTAPKRKRPRPLPEENSRSSVMVKAETEQLVKVEAVEKFNIGSVAENGGVSFDLSNHSRVDPLDSSEQILLDSKPLTAQQQQHNVNESRKDENHSASPRTGSPPETNREDSVPSKLNLMVTESESKREEKFQIDLMAPPPQTKSSPERDGETSFAAPETKKFVPHIETEIKTATTTKEDEKRSKTMKELDMRNAVETDEKHVKRAILEESEHCKPIIVNKERFCDLQLDLAKNVTKQTQQQQLQQTPPPQTKSTRDDHNNEKNAQSSGSLPMQMPLASWPGGFSPMGYMPPLQGVMPMDGRNVSAATVQPPQLLLNQPRPKRCATHCYIARNISYHQQFTRMNPFWPAAAGNASLYGAKPCNLNVVPSTELHANFGVRNGNSVQDKGHANTASHAAKEKGSHTSNNTDVAQRKQVVLQQTVPPVAPNNILHGPAFIFPLSQQQAAAATAAASARSTSGRTVSAGAGSGSSNSSAIAVGASAAAAMTFNYPNVPANETQFLAILPNNGYPFPIPANVGASPAAYRGPHAQAMPFFNGSFYSSQLLHPGQQQHQSSPQGLQIQHSSGGLPSTQKHLQNQQQQQQQRTESNGGNSGNGSLHQTIQVTKNRSSQTAQHQNQHISLPLPQQSRPLESKGGAQDPSASENHGPHANMSVYGQNFAMPIHAPNFALMTPVALGGTGGSTNNNHNEKKLQQSQQQQGMKPGMDSMPSQAFAVTFTSLNNGGGPTPGLDISSVAAQSHAILQNFSDTANRQGYQFLTASGAVQASQQKKNMRIPEGKSGGGGASDNANPEEERKSMAGKPSAKLGQSIAFSRSDAADSSISNVIDSSARSLNLVSGSGRASGSLVSGPMNNASSPSPQQRQQHQQHQQLIQLHKQQQQQQYTAVTARNKMPATGNGNVYLDHLPSSSAMAAAKFPSAFPQNFVQNNSGSPTQSPQWKNSSRTTTSQAHSPSMSSSTTSSQKNIPQQQGRPQQGHMSISFGGNPKSSPSPQVHPPPGSSNQTPSPVMVGSPTTSSMSKGASGSPRTTASNSGNRTGQASTFSSSASQQGKNSPTVPSRKSSPVGGKNVPSILGNPHITSSASPSVKPQLAQQLQHNQLPKQGMQQAQLFFSNPYMQTSQAPHSTGSNASSAPSATPGAYYIQRQVGQKQSQGPSSTTSSGMLSLYPPVSLTNASSVASAKTVATGNNMKGGVPQGIIHAPQFASVNQQLMPAGFPYVHSIPTVKPAEQKQQADE